MGLQLARLGEGMPVCTCVGGEISPILSNIYLHEVLDRWFEEEGKPRMCGEATLIRYADDAVLVFEREEDAQRVMEVLAKRFARYGLTLHPEKTRLVRFQRPEGPPRGRAPGTFDFLGFTHYWGKSRGGNGVVKRKTARTRMARALKSVGLWLRQKLHLGVVDQFLALTRKLEGHYGYYGITGNSDALQSFRYQVVRLWRKWLGRRSQRAKLNWLTFNQFLARFPLPSVRIVHSAYRHVVSP